MDNYEARREAKLIISVAESLIPPMTDNTDEQQKQHPHDLSPEERQEREALAVKAKWLFGHPCEFVTSVFDLPKLPQDDRVEIAFAGRSNVGKSSLINYVFQKKGLAKASSTPGRTQSLNFFKMDRHMHVVDMPGYGYAKAPKSMVDDWNRMLRTYLRGRAQLKRVFLLIDSRHGLKKNDEDIMTMLDESAVSYQVILTKIDKIKTAGVPKLIRSIEDQFANHPALYPEVLTSSSEKAQGQKDIRLAIARVYQDFH